MAGRKHGLDTTRKTVTGLDAKAEPSAGYPGLDKDIDRRVAVLAEVWRLLKLLAHRMAPGDE